MKVPEVGAAHIGALGRALIGRGLLNEKAGRRGLTAGGLLQDFPQLVLRAEGRLSRLSAQVCQVAG